MKNDGRNKVNEVKYVVTIRENLLDFLYIEELQHIKSAPSSEILTSVDFEGICGTKHSESCTVSLCL